MSMPIVPPFAVTASYQKDQMATGTYVQGGSQVFSHLVTPPSSGVAAETSADSAAHAAGFTAYSNASEVQLVTINGSPTGGTFELEWGGQVTSALSNSPTSAQVQTALRALSNVPITTAAINDVQTVSVTGAPTGGTFTLSFSGQTTSGIAFNAIGSVVQTAFLALSSVGAGNATVTGGAGGPYVVTFIGTLAGGARAGITASGASLTGGTSPGVSIVHTTTGAATVYSVAATGSTGGPFTVTFSGKLANENLDQIHPTALALTGGTNPAVVVTTTTGGEAAFTNVALANAHQVDYSFANRLDSGSGNHF